MKAHNPVSARRRYKRQGLVVCHSIDRNALQNEQWRNWVVSIRRNRMDMEERDWRKMVIRGRRREKSKKAGKERLRLSLPTYSCSWLQ